MSNPRRDSESAIAKRDAGLDLSPRDVALACGTRVQKVLAWIGSGELEADDVSADLSKKPRWRIRAAALDAFFERRRQARRNPRRAKTRKPKQESLIDPATGRVRSDLGTPGAFRTKGGA